MKKFFLCLVIVAISTLTYSQVKETDWHSRNLNGKVKSLRESCYKAHKLSGEIRKGKRQTLTWDDFSYIVYNDSGKKIETAELSIDGKINSRRTYVYDNNGNSIAMELIDANGNSSKHTYVNTYDGKGNLIVSIHLRPDSSVDNKCTYTYDPNGNLVEYNWYRADGSLESKNKYSDKKKIIESNVYKPSGEIEWKLIYKYDDKGNRVEETIYKGEAKFIIKYLMKYDAHGNQAEIDWCKKSGKIYRKYFSKYQYDSMGNWITQTEFRGDKPIYIFERELTYFSE